MQSVFEELKGSRINSTTNVAAEAVTDVMPKASIKEDGEVKPSLESHTTVIDMRVLQRTAMDHFDQVAGDILHLLQGCKLTKTPRRNVKTRSSAAPFSGVFLSQASMMHGRGLY